jgi:hypothetical protein
MGRGVFNSLNKEVEVFMFQTYSSSADTFNPAVSLNVGGDRVLWSLGDGSQYVAGNGLSYVYADSGTTKTVKLLVPKLKRINGFIAQSKKIKGSLDTSNLIGFTNSSNFFIDNNPLLTGFTQPNVTTNIRQFSFTNCDITGYLDLSNIVIGGTMVLPGFFQGSNNVNLTGITHSTSNLPISTYTLGNCDLIGNLDVSMLSGLSGTFSVGSNSSLTGITHTPSSNTFTLYSVGSCNLIGNFDVSILSGLSGVFSASFNSNLTGITHSNSSNIFTNYSVNNCGLIGNLDLTPLSGLGGNFNFHFNSNLTGITNPYTTQNFTQYNGYNCNITGILDMTPITNLGGASSGSTGVFRVNSNPNLTGVIFPTVTNYFKNLSNIENGGVFVMHSSNLDYVDFTPLSGVTLLTGSTQGNPRISLRDNNMSAGDVNHILVDFSGNTTVNPVGWSNVNLNIGGTNADPDSSSGGYDGLAAIATLTGSPYNWTITY